jgi:uncharacterized protein YndB with AHSA1/START domain
MAAEQNSQTKPGAFGERDFLISRVFDAPVALVYQAWTNPKHMSKWWGPEGFEISDCKLDVRVGGKYSLVMSGQGMCLPLTGEYKEVVPNKKLVATIDPSGHPKEWHDAVVPDRDPNDSNPVGIMLQTVTFEDVGGKTKLTIQTTLKSAKIRDAVVNVGMYAGWSSSLNRLDAELSHMVSWDDTAGREMVITRLFDAPRELVWKAWTDPKQMVKWWGPNGFSTTMISSDFRVGGSSRYTMHGPDGTNYPNRQDYLEIKPNEKIVYVHGDDSDDGLRFQSTITFENHSGKTLLTLRALFPTAEVRDAIVKEHGAVEGGKQTLARLAGHLDAVAGGAEEREIVTTRIVDAPPELVWNAWTDPDQVGKWWGPNGFKCTVQQMDVRPGGEWRLILHGPDGTDYPNRSIYVELDKPRKIVFDHDSTPKFQMVTTFADEGGKTRVTMRMVFKSADDRELCAMKFGAVDGARQTLERLGDHVTTK